MKWATGNIKWVFEELQIVPDHECLVWGEAEISYETEPADPDVGYRGGVNFSVDSIMLYADVNGKPGLELPHNHPLFSMIDAALHSPRYEYKIIEEIEESLS